MADQNPINNDQNMQSGQINQLTGQRPKKFSECPNETSINNDAINHSSMADQPIRHIPRRNNAQPYEPNSSPIEIVQTPQIQRNLSEQANEHSNETICQNRPEQIQQSIRPPGRTQSRRFPPQRTRSEFPKGESISETAIKVLNQKPTDDKPKNYFLKENICKLSSPQFIRQNTHIQYEEDFPNDLFNNSFDEYYKKLKDKSSSSKPVKPENNEDVEKAQQSECKEAKESPSQSNNKENEEDNTSLPSFLKDKLKDYLSENKDFSELPIEWMTISNANVSINNIFVKCKLQLTAKSSLSASYSLFTPQDLTKTESAIEVFANSKATFEKCYFNNAGRVAVIARNYSTVVFKDCIFDNNKISCFVMDDSYAKFENCIFTKDQNISLFVTKDSKSELYDCVFYNTAGKAIFAKDASQVYVTSTIFNQCQKGASTIAEGSSLFLDNNISIINPHNTAIRAINNSHVKAQGLNIQDTEGNAINIENSDGFFFDCNISGTVHPTIAVIGRKANPIFHNCKLIQNKNTFCVICKNCCRPLFDECEFFDCETNCFSISDFSRPHIQKCKFKNIKNDNNPNIFYLNVFSGSNVTYDNLISLDEGVELKDKIHVAPRSKCCEKEIKNVEEDFQKELMNNEKTDVDQDDSDRPRIRSWRSPTYEPPPDIKAMIEPTLIQSKALTPLVPVVVSIILKEIDDFKKEKESPYIPQFVCSLCHKIINEEEEEPHILCPCGHAIHEGCKSNLVKCPICDSPIKEVKKVFKESECTICYDISSNTISMPCAHLCMCYGCASKCAEKNYNCPMCNEALTGYKFLFSDVEAEE